MVYSYSIEASRSPKHSLSLPNMAVADDIPDDKISYLGLLPVFMDISFTFYASLFAAPFRGKHGASTYRRAVSYALLREILSGFSVAEGQKLSPSTDKAYRRIARSQHWEAHTIDLANGAKGLWLDHSNAKYVLVYFHGGGYIAAATPGHLKYQFALQKAIRKLGYDFSIFSLAYTLAPKAVYPTQLNQAVSAIRYLVQDQKRDPNTIIIAGDSAGGNLAAALLSHLAHPHGKLSELNLGGSLRGALMISPWISFQTSDPSFKENAKSDYLTIAALDRASNTYIGPGGRHDNYSEPIRAHPEWWAGVSTVVDEVLIWGGGDEILIDGIRRFQANMKEGFEMAKSLGPSVATGLGTTPDGRPKTPTLQENGALDRHGAVSPTPPFQTPDESGLDRNVSPVSPIEEKKTEAVGGGERVKFVETPRMAHEEMIIDYILRIGGKREGARAIEGWLDALLRER